MWRHRNGDYFCRDAHLNWDLRDIGLIQLDEIWSPRGIQFRNRTTKHLRCSLAFYEYILKGVL